MSERRTVTSTITEISGYDLDGSVDAAIKRLNNLKETYPGQKLGLDWGQHDPYSDSYVFKVTAERPETDEEMASRITIEEANAEKIRDRELKELARLSDKYKDVK